MFRKTDILASQQKLFAKDLLKKSFSAVVRKQKLPDFLNDISYGVLLEEKDKSQIADAYLKFKQKYKKPEMLQEFKLALDDFILEKYIQQIETKVSHVERELIDKIIKELRKRTLLGNNFSMSDRIFCASDLLKYIETEHLAPNTVISDDIINKYPRVFKRFSKDIKEFNDKIRRPQLEKLIEPKFYYANDIKDFNTYVSSKNANSFTYFEDLTSASASKLSYIKFSKEEQNIDISGLNPNELAQLATAIKNKDLSKLKVLLKDAFPEDNELQLATKAFKESSIVKKLQARVGAVVSIRSKKPQGDKARGKEMRQADIYGRGINDRLDNLREISALCNAKANEYGFANSKNNGMNFEVWTGPNAPDINNPVVRGKDKDAFILHFNNGNLGLYHVDTQGNSPTLIKIPLSQDILDKLGYDLIYIATQKRSEKYRPSSKVHGFSIKYKKDTDSLQTIIDIGDDLINFIIDRTGYVPSQAMQNPYQESSDIHKKVYQSKDYIDKLTSITPDIKNKYKDILSIIEKISELPNSYITTSDSVVPRYKCKDILQRLTECAANPNDELTQEYIRSTYIFYQCLHGIPNDGELQKYGPNNPRFYFDAQTNNIVYVDALNVVHRSKLKVAFKIGFDPDKLVNIISKKPMNNDGSIILDSEEVFKYISQCVEDKDGFKMHTVNEELEEIIADEVATTKDALLNFGIMLLYTGLMMLLVLVPGINILFFAAATFILNLTPFLINSLAMGAYKDAIKNLGMAIAMMSMTLFLIFVPGLNFMGVVTAASYMVYVTLALASLTAAFKLGATLNDVSKNPNVKEANKELLNLKEKIKSLTKEDVKTPLISADESDEEDVETLRRAM